MSFTLKFKLRVFYFNDKNKKKEYAQFEVLICYDEMRNTDNNNLKDF